MEDRGCVSKETAALPEPRALRGRAEGLRAWRGSGCMHHLSSLWANPLGRGEIAPPATSSGSFPLPVVTVTSALLGVRLRLGGINFCPGFYFPSCGSARGAVTSGSVSKEAEGLGGAWVRPRWPGTSPGCLPGRWAWVGEKFGGGGEGDRAAWPGPVMMAVVLVSGPGSGS